MVLVFICSLVSGMSVMLSLWGSSLYHVMICPLRPYSIYRAPINRIAFEAFRAWVLECTPEVSNWGQVEGLGYLPQSLPLRCEHDVFNSWVQRLGLRVEVECGGA